MRSSKAKLGGFLALTLLVGLGVFVGRPTSPPATDGGDPDGVEAGGQSTTAYPRCGDGHIDPGEDCDSLDDEMACSTLVANGDGVATCSLDCTWDLTDCQLDRSVCGNGSLEAGELCDDGNRSNGDGCDSACVVEIGGRPVHFDGHAVDVATRRTLDGSTCYDPAVREGMSARGRRSLPIRLFVCELPNGEPVYPLGRIREVLSDVERAFSSAGLEFVEVEAVQAPFDGDCVIPFGDPSLRQMAADSRASGAVPLFFVQAIRGGPSPSSHARGFAGIGYGAALAGTERDVIVHEIGHVLGLLHTHSCAGTDVDDCSASGDGICDTPFDPGPSWLRTRCPGVPFQTCSADCDGECSDGATPDRGNYMSYFGNCRGRFTPDQRDLMRCVVDNHLEWLDANPACRSEQCNARDDDCDGEVDEDDVCQEECLPHERLRHGVLSASTVGFPESFGGNEYPEGSPDRLFLFEPAEQGLHCFRISPVSAGPRAAVPLVLTTREGCGWNDPVVRSNYDMARSLLSDNLEVRAGPGAPAWIGVDGWGVSDGVAFNLDIRPGSCQSQGERPLPPAENFNRTRRPPGPDQPRLTPPLLLEPEPDALLPSLTTDFRWDAVEGASLYELRVGLDARSLRSEACSECIRGGVEGLWHQPTTRVLGLEIDYFWTVRAIGTHEIGPFAPPREFRFEDWECTRVGRIGVGETAESHMPVDDHDAISSSCSARGPNEWVWLINPQETQLLCIEPEAQFDTDLSVRTACENRSTELACDDDTSLGIPLGPSQVQVQAHAQQPLFAIVEGFTERDTGQYSLTVSAGACVGSR